jgi:phosphoserine phosphatase
MTSDLVIQAENLAPDAADAFVAACLAPSHVRRGNAVRMSGVRDDADTRTIVTALAAYWKCDTAFVDPRLRIADYRVLVTDMDSTLITIECIDELARLAGKGPEVAAITAAAMRGEIADFSESLRRRVALLAGTEAGLVERVTAERLRLSPGAGALLTAARGNGWKTLLVSGGFTSFADGIRHDLEMDESWANELEVRDGHLTGMVAGPAQNDGHIVDGAAKARALRTFCTAHGCTARQAIAVGDGANDLAMMGAAGLSIAYRAKPVVRERATYALNHTGLDGILNLFSDGW